MKNTKKILINTCYGGFGVSPKLREIYSERTGSELPENYDIENREDETLISISEEIGLAEASDKHAELKIIEIPFDVEYKIHDYDGLESIHEVHRVWR